MNQKRWLVFAVLFFSQNLLANTDLYQMANYIRDSNSVNCMWVNQVGDTAAGGNVKFQDVSALCVDGKGSPKSGICQGTIRCTGMGGGWGDVYFEDVSCGGSNVGGEAVCGLTNSNIEGTRGYTTGVKSCLGSYINGGPKIQRLKDSSDHTVTPGSETLKVSQ